jgi:UDPglucose--hexose-1-phosphate uridylyltransferase
MHRLEIVNPDGRLLTLYGRQPLVDIGPLNSPRASSPAPNPHLRWQPLRGEWVAYAAHRQNRTFLPPPQYNPLAPWRGGEYPTELPTGDYDVAVLDNLFPSLSASAHDPPPMSIPTLAGTGRCEVVVFTQDPTQSLGTLPVEHIELVLEVLAERTQRLGSQSEIHYVLPFENRGVEVGVTLHHPHGQIYAYPFVPPVPQRMQERELAHYQSSHRPLLESLIEGELESDQRILWRGEHAVAFVPPWARYPYEVWVAPRRATPWLHALDAPERAELALALRTVLRKYDGLWSRPFPYVMAWYQAPTDGAAHPESHLHAEFYPPYRAADRLKYLAGTELAAGLFVCDRLPEDSARELRAVPA